MASIESNPFGSVVRSNATNLRRRVATGSLLDRGGGGGGGGGNDEAVENVMTFWMARTHRSQSRGECQFQALRGCRYHKAHCGETGCEGESFAAPNGHSDYTCGGRSALCVAVRGTGHQMKRQSAHAGPTPEKRQTLPLSGRWYLPVAIAGWSAQAPPFGRQIALSSGATLANGTEQTAQLNRMGVTPGQNGTLEHGCHVWRGLGARYGLGLRPWRRRGGECHGSLVDDWISIAFRCWSG